MSDKKLHARDKTVQKMNRDGLVEQNLSTGEKQRITKRAQDFFSAKGRYCPMKASTPPPKKRAKRGRTFTMKRRLKRIRNLPSRTLSKNILRIITLCSM